MPPEVIGPGNAVGSQIGPVDWVIKVTPRFLDAAGVLEVIWNGVLVVEVCGTLSFMMEVEPSSETVEEEPELAVANVEKIEPPVVVVGIDAELENNAVS